MACCPGAFFFWETFEVVRCDMHCDVMNKWEQQTGQRKWPSVSHPVTEQRAWHTRCCRNPSLGAHGSMGHMDDLYIGESGGHWDMGPCSDSLVPDQTIHRNRLIGPILPHRPSESCHHMGSRWASSGVSIWTSAPHGTRKRYCCSKEHNDHRA